jgi:hypothetical protein
MTSLNFALAPETLQVLALIVPLPVLLVIPLIMGEPGQGLQVGGISGSEV